MSLVHILKKYSFDHDTRESAIHAQTYAGRPVRRVVSLFDTVHDLVEENDRRQLLELENESEVPTIEYVIDSLTQLIVALICGISVDKTGSFEVTNNFSSLCRPSRK